MKLRTLGWALIEYDWTPYKMKRQRHTGTMPYDDRDRDWSDTAVSPGGPRIPSHYQKLGKASSPIDFRARKDSPL